MKFRLMKFKAPAMATPTPELVTPGRVQTLVNRAATANGLDADQKHLLARASTHFYKSGLPWRQIVEKTYGAAARMANNRDRRQLRSVPR